LPQLRSFAKPPFIVVPLLPPLLPDYYRPTLPPG
jgi:hypothetical protein